ncbi:hypothetical protein FHX46_004352 [Amycolatopsis viridis]|uniref:Uncharacterized protein n=1 Tax=Amycolatopsis viridis TaxID=185678 RepID=A0ABX0SY17_9PSEU|nr:hypothetical protein [Amycolatopsis viridis]
MTGNPPIVRPAFRYDGTRSALEFVTAVLGFR